MVVGLLRARHFAAVAERDVEAVAVGRVSTSKPVGDQSVPSHFAAIIWVMGKRELGVVRITTPGYASGLSFSVKFDAMSITFLRVRSLPARLSTSHIVYAIATP